MKNKTEFYLLTALTVIVGSLYTFCVTISIFPQILPMLKRLFLGSILVCFLSSNLKAQESTDYYYGVSAATTILSSGLMGGVGSLIHKKPGDRGLRAFGNGFLKGMAGGAVSWTGKYMLGYIPVHKEYTWAWPAHLVNSLGVSMTDNAVRNIGLFDRFGLEVGLLRIDYDCRKNKPQFRSLPFVAFGAGWIMLEGGQFDWRTSVKTGHMVFTNHDYINYNNFGAFSYDPDGVNKNVQSAAWGRNEYVTAAHEMVHSFQYREGTSFNYLFYKNNMRFVYWDSSVMKAMYQAFAYYGDYNNKGFHWNYYEMEAELLAKRTSQYMEVSKPKFLFRPQ